MNDATEIGKRLGRRFPEGIECAPHSPRRLYARVDPRLLLDVARWLLEQIPGLRLATSTGIDLRDGVDVLHHFAVNGSPLVITIKALAAKPGPRLPSLAALTPAADWIEREISELLGVAFDGHPDPRRLLKARTLGDQVLPLRRDFDPRTIKETTGEPPAR